MKIDNYFYSADRYYFDSKLIPQGFAQIDTSQDASYFGTWGNPCTLEIFSYTEGDCRHIICADVSEFRAEVERIKNWNEGNGHRFIGVDPGLNPARRQEWVDIGLGHLL